jgi:exonuclease III
MVSLMAAMLINGCSTNKAIPAAITSEGVLITTVDTGMKIWAIYVNAGKATQSQVDTVKKYYTDYYNAQLVAEAALTRLVSAGSTNTAEVTAANATVVTAENQLLTTLNSFIK